MAKHRSYAQRALKAEARRFLRLTRRELVQLTALAAAVSAVEVALPSPEWLTGFTVGFFLTACVAMLGFAFLINGDAVYLIVGALGETNTADTLDAAKKAGLIWSYIPNLEASGRDVDHLVLTPAGLLALESKWRLKGADEKWMHWAAGTAEAAARQARLVLQAKPIELRTDVRPVVVIWGGARRELPNARVVAGVEVIRGDHLLTWLERWSRGTLAEDNAEQLHAKLVAFADSHRAA